MRRSVTGSLSAGTSPSWLTGRGWSKAIAGPTSTSSSARFARHSATADSVSSSRFSSRVRKLSAAALPIQNRRVRREQVPDVEREIVADDEQRHEFQREQQGDRGPDRKLPRGEEANDHH